MPRGEGSATRGDARRAQESIANALFAWRSWIAFALIMGLALAIRLYRLDEVPANLTADETDFLREAYAIMDGPSPGWLSQGQTASVGPLGAYAVRWSLAIFGDSVVGVRMYAVCFSMAVLALFFVAARLRLSLLSASVATLLFAANLLALNFSRTGWANMNGAFIAVGVGCCLVLAHDRRRWWWYLAAGVLTGLSVYAYLGARLIPFIVAGYALAMLPLHRVRWREHLAGFALAGVAALIVAAPVLLELRSNDRFNTQYTERARTVSIFRNRSDSEAWDLVPGNIRRSARGYLLLSSDGNIFRRSTEGVRYAPFDEQLFDPLTRVLYWAGLAAGIWWWKRAIFWWLLLFVPLITQVFSTGTPDAARGIVLLPAIFYFVALGTEVTYLLGRRFVRPPPLRAFSAAAALALVLAMCVANVRQYFDWMESTYALEERGPYVWNHEFDEWSFLQHASQRATGSTFNTGSWRDARDRGGCYTGQVGPTACVGFRVEPEPAPLGAALVRPDELPGELRQASLTEIGADEYARVEGGRSNALIAAFQGLSIDEAWATVYYGPNVILTASAARFASVGDARAFMDARRPLDGGDFLGGPQSEDIEPLDPPGDDALLEHFTLGDRQWWDYYWREGAVVARVTALYFALDVQPKTLERFSLDILYGVVEEQAGRIAALE